LDARRGISPRTEGEFVLRQFELGGEKAATRFQEGQKLWVNGRVATFLYPGADGAAVVRYAGETMSRVVSAHKLTAAAPV
jgi:hypothetical protein